MPLPPNAEPHPTPPCPPGGLGATSQSEPVAFDNSRAISCEARAGASDEAQGPSAGGRSPQAGPALTPPTARAPRLGTVGQVPGQRADSARPRAHGGADPSAPAAPSAACRGGTEHGLAEAVESFLLLAGHRARPVTSTALAGSQPLGPPPTDNLSGAAAPRDTCPSHCHHPGAWTAVPAVGWALHADCSHLQEALGRHTRHSGRWSSSCRGLAVCKNTPRSMLCLTLLKSLSPVLGARPSTEKERRVLCSWHRGVAVARARVLGSCPQVTLPTPSHCSAHCPQAR